MRREVEYLQVTATFIIRARDARLLTRGGNDNAVRRSLASLVYSRIVNGVLLADTRARIDAEEFSVTVDGEPQPLEGEAR